MTRFIAGIIATLAVQLIGWPAIESGLGKASEAVRSAYASLETQTAHIREVKR